MMFVLPALIFGLKLFSERLLSRLMAAGNLFHLARQQ